MDWIKALPGREGFTTFIGVLTALNAGVLISAGMTLQKKSHMMIKTQKKEVYYTHPTWWKGGCCLAAGELLNFASFACAPVSLLAPMGSWSVALGSWFALRYLGERVSRRRVIGIILCILGTVMVLSMFPYREEPNPIITNPALLRERLRSPAVITFVGGEFGISVLFMVLTAITKVGTKSSVFYLLICSLSEGVTIVFAKAAATLLRFAIVDWSTKSLLTLLALGIGLAITLFTQIIYLNKAMEFFKNSEVVPMHFVLFTMCTMAGAEVVFNELDKSTAQPILYVFAILVAFWGVYMVATCESEEGSPPKKYEQLV